MQPVHRRLVVVRHAKSAWPGGVADHDRPLGPRGLADAPVMAAEIAAVVGAVDVAVISPTRRTRQTWELLAQSVAVAEPVVVDERIYRDWGAGLLDVVHDLPDGAGTALLLGHQPGVGDLVADLARIDVKFPTCAVAVLGLPVGVDWAQVSLGSADLLAYRTPREVRG